MLKNYCDKPRTLDETIRDAIYDYMHFCDECPKAYYFTCSGADAKKCEKEKNKLFDLIKELISIKRNNR